MVRDSEGRVFTWGFGGYGRLGHQQPKDEHVPRLLAFFNNRGSFALPRFEALATKITLMFSNLTVFAYLLHR